MKQQALLGVVAVAALLLSGCGGNGNGSSGEGGSAPSEQEGGGNGSKEVTPGNAAEKYVGSALEAKEAAESVAGLQPVRQAIRQFKAGEGRLPKSLKELVSEGYLQKIPTLAQGQELEYDPKTGEVTVTKTE